MKIISRQDYSSVLAVVWLLSSIACCVPQIKVETTYSVAKTEPFYISYTVDAFILSAHPRWLNFDFKSEKLQTLMKGLSPALWRFGGSPADYTVFVDDQSWNQKMLNATKVLPMLQPITREDLTNMVTLARTVGAKLLFDLNHQLRYGEQWDPINAGEFLKYIDKQGYGNTMDLELGNEPFAATSPQALVDGNRIAKDFATLRLIMSMFPSLKNSRLVGPDIQVISHAGAQQCFFAMANSTNTSLNAITFHHYYFRGDIAKIEQYLDPAYFHNLEDTIVTVKRAVRPSLRPNIPLWIGETSDSWASGTPNVSDRFISGFLWLEKLGLSARLGVSVVMRQALYGQPYALLDLQLNPNPDYWLSYIFKKLVGQTVLDVTSMNLPNTTRVYAHCASASSGYPPGSITLYALNMANVSSMFQLSAPLTTSPSDYFVLTPGDSNGLLSKLTSVNMQPLHMVDNKTLPVIQPKHMPAAQALDMPPYSLAFYVFHQLPKNVCS